MSKFEDKIIKEVDGKGVDLTSSREHSVNLLEVTGDRDTVASVMGCRVAESGYVANGVIPDLKIPGASDDTAGSGRSTNNTHVFTGYHNLMLHPPDPYLDRLHGVQPKELVDGVKGTAAEKDVSPPSCPIMNTEPFEQSPGLRSSVAGRGATNEVVAPLMPFNIGRNDLRIPSHNRLHMLTPEEIERFGSMLKLPLKEIKRGAKQR